MTAHPRFNGRLAAGAALALSVMLTAVGAPPAAAAVPDRGDHGAQAQCRYVSVASEGWSGTMRLKRLTIQPPTLFSVAASSEVGWRFIVQRSYDSPWKRIFTSRTQRTSATPAQAADFSALSAYINSPLLIPDGQGGYRHADYRAVLQFYWYADDGSIERSERHRVQFYDVLRDGAYLWTDAGDCSHAWAFM